MKEQIKQIIQNSVNFHFKCEDGTTYWYLYDKEIDDLAARLDKAIGIDEKKINSELISRNEWFYKFQEGNASGSWLRHKIAKAIAQSRPLKCEVTNE